MLRTLHIENIAVIRLADLSFGTGLTVLTGETGAGKSVLIDSLGFLTGSKVGKELIRSGESQAVVSAVFSEVGDAAEQTAAELGVFADEGEYLLERKLSSDGRSFARINGKPVTLGILREIGGAFLTVHGQHDSLRLVRENEQLAAVDAYAENDQSLTTYREVYHQLHIIRSEMEKLRSDESERARLTEILQFQIGDIDAKKLKPGEEEDLLTERDKLRSLEKIVKQVNLTCRILTDHEQGNVVSLIDRTLSALGQIRDVTPEAAELCEKLNTMRYDLVDVSERARELIPDTNGDPVKRLDWIEGRLDAISRLKKKYGGTIEEILEFRAHAAEQLNALTHSDETAADLSAEEKRLVSEAERLAAVLTEKRLAAADVIASSVVEALLFLDMPKVRFVISVTPSELGENGADTVSYLLSANAGEPLAPMSGIASGGELSRIMLALSDVMNRAVGAATIIYDEIDTGISGSTSRKVGIKLKHTAGDVQTLCVTHSAQIASLADHHFFISKSEKNGRTETSVKELTEAERIVELSRILGGIQITDAQRAAAVDMMEEGKML